MVQRTIYQDSERDQGVLVEEPIVCYKNEACRLRFSFLESQLDEFKNLIKSEVGEIKNDLKETNKWIKTSVLAVLLQVIMILIGVIGYLLSHYVFS